MQLPPGRVKWQFYSELPADLEQVSPVEGPAAVAASLSAMALLVLLTLLHVVVGPSSSHQALWECRWHLQLRHPLASPQVLDTMQTMLSSSLGYPPVQPLLWCEEGQKM